MMAFARRREHCAHGFAAHQKSAQAADTPATLELVDPGVEDRFSNKATGVENDEARGAEIARDRCEEIAHGALFGGIARVALRARAELREEPRERAGVASCCSDLHSRRCESARECGAQSRPCTDHHCGFRCHAIPPWDPIRYGSGFRRRGRAFLRTWRSRNAAPCAPAARDRTPRP